MKHIKNRLQGFVFFFYFFTLDSRQPDIHLVLIIWSLVWDSVTTLSDDIPI